MYNYDKTNCITNLSNSILKRFNANPHHSSIKKIDELLKDKKKVLVFLFDGMGDNILKEHLKEDSFFRSHIIHQMDATFPPTTVASTNSFLSGLFPIENAWFGWSQYFEKIDRNVAIFWNTDDDTDEYLGDKSFIHEVASYKRIDEQINESNKKRIAKAIFGYPIDKKDKRVRFLNKFVGRAFASANSKEESFVYAYWNCPDSKMHVNGISSPKVHGNIKRIQKLVKSYSKKYKDVATLVIADHGLIDIEYLPLDNHPDLVGLLKRNPSFESRTVNFFIKENKHDEFVELFNKYYRKYFELYSKKEVFEKELFGEGTPHKYADIFIGDYIAVAIDKFALTMHDYKDKLKAHHAGGTSNEFKIDIIGINL